MAGDICRIGRVKIEFVNGSVCSAGLTTLGAAAAVPQTNEDVWDEILPIQNKLMHSSTSSR